MSERSGPDLLNRMTPAGVALAFTGAASEILAGTIGYTMTPSVYTSAAIVFFMVVNWLWSKHGGVG